MNEAQQTTLDDLLDLWEEAHEQGKPFDAESLCAQCPELLPELQNQINALGQINQMLGTQTEGFSNDADDDLPELSLNEKLIANIGLTNAQFHAEGALGRVYLAQDMELNREVAIKFMQKRHMHDHARKDRFCLEAEITSRLYHPGVVPVHGIGQTEDKRPFYVTQFV
ncbi:MAG: hypothetical protein HOH33_02255, partial [Verrucomicrobia bacterium]|nr:hypothetical protein [Verrucomicrobiota bacterium]